MRPAHLRSERGFTLVEVMVASLVLLIGVLGTMALVDGASLRTLATKQREGGNVLARELVEQVRAVPYGQLTPNSVAPKLQEQPGLADENLASGSWTVKRRGTVYTIAAHECAVDDPKDGVGTTEGSDFCQINTTGCSGAINAEGSATVAGSTVTLCVDLGGTTISTLCGTVVTGASGTVSAGGSGGSTQVCGSGAALDDNPDDYKLVLFDVSWGSGGRRMRQATVIPNPGQGAGPAIRAIVATGLSSDVISGTSASQDFAVTTSTTPASVQWSVDGAVQGQAGGAGTAWSFSWDTSGEVDGTYVIGARAYDANGQGGIAGTRAITINRGPPQAPSGFVAGRNGSAIDFEWDGNRERDIVGYRVFQQVSSGSDPVLCELTDNTDCIDTSPPADNPIDVYVVAYDRDLSGNLRAGTASAVRTVTSDNQAPYPPTSLGASSTGGSTILTWSAPSPADPDSGDAIEFYRVYRDGSSYADRYDETTCSGTTCSWTDTHVDGVEHTYYVTAVDGQLAESVLAGPVTR